MKTKKKAGRRLKRDWRRKIDVTDVDQFLDEKRLEERIGYGVDNIILCIFFFVQSSCVLAFYFWFFF